MKPGLEISELLGGTERFEEELHALLKSFPQQSRQWLFPYHFLASAFPKIGGRILAVHQDRKLAGAAFLFPRSLAGGIPVYTCRWHPLKVVSDEQVEQEIGAFVSPDQIVFYRPEEARRFSGEENPFGEFSIGRPSEREAYQIRELQRIIWGYETDEFLYPIDLHSEDFRPGTTLVVRRKGRVVGFLFGFYKFKSPRLPEQLRPFHQNELKIESQLLGVLPDYRGRGLGRALKVWQARQAVASGIRLINWTVDPLQYRNAVLNFGELRAVSFQFAANYYRFSNALNRVRPSRLVITWPIASRRVKSLLENADQPRDLPRSITGELEIANQDLRSCNLFLDSKWIGIRIPRNWSKLQNENLAEADLWRNGTDTILEYYLNRRDTTYFIKEVGEWQGEPCLFAEKMTPPSLAELLPANTN